MTHFALIGAAGYIAPRHLKAIKENDGTLCAAFDINDSVGIMDSYFPNAAFFTEFEQFDAHIHTLKAEETAIDYVSICSPNYLHKAHIHFALRVGGDAICEKPLVLVPSDIEELEKFEGETGKRVNAILQLRLHPSIIALREKIAQAPADKVFDVDLSYFTSRGAWYHASWKGLETKSGGIATNIGVHFFDMLGFVFGRVRQSVVHHRSADATAGYLEFERARVRWILSINRTHLPIHTLPGQNTYRSITIDGEEVEFSSGFTDLHTTSYQNIMSGNGYGLAVVRPAIELTSQIHSALIEPRRGERHPDIARLS